MKKTKNQKKIEQDFYKDFLEPYSEMLQEVTKYQIIANNFLNKKKKYYKKIHDNHYVALNENSFTEVDDSSFEKKEVESKKTKQNEKSDFEKLFENSKKENSAIQNLDNEIGLNEENQNEKSTIQTSNIIKSQIENLNKENSKKKNLEVKKTIIDISKDDKEKIDKMFGNEEHNDPSLNQILPKNDNSKDENLDDIFNQSQSKISDALKEFINTTDIDPEKITFKRGISKSMHEFKEEKSQLIDYYGDPKKHLSDFYKFQINLRNAPKVFIVAEISLKEKPFYPEDLIETLKKHGILGVKSVEFGFNTSTGAFSGFAYLELSSIEIKHILLKLNTIESLNYIGEHYHFNTNFRNYKELEKLSIGTNQIQGQSRYYITNLPQDYEIKHIMNMFLNIPVKNSPFVVSFISLYYYNNGQFKGNCHVNISTELNAEIFKKLGGVITDKTKNYVLSRNNNVRADYYK